MEAKSQDSTLVEGICCELLWKIDSKIVFYRHGHVCYTIDLEKGKVKVAEGEDLLTALCVAFACDNI